MLFVAGGGRQAFEEGADAGLFAPKRRRHGAVCQLLAASACQVWPQNDGDQPKAAARFAELAEYSWLQSLLSGEGKGSGLLASNI